MRKANTIALERAAPNEMTENIQSLRSVGHPAQASNELVTLQNPREQWLEQPVAGTVNTKLHNMHKYI